MKKTGHTRSGKKHPVLKIIICLAAVLVLAAAAVVLFATLTEYRPAEKDSRDHTQRF